MKYILVSATVFLMSLMSCANASETGNMSLQQLIGVSGTNFDFSNIHDPMGRPSRVGAKGAKGVRAKGTVGRQGRSGRN